MRPRVRHRADPLSPLGFADTPDVVASALPNGLRLRVAPMPHARSVTVSISFATGSRYEEASEQGIAHLVEHMLFKGTAKYPTAQIISEAIEGVGGIINASTDKEITTYWIKVASEHLDLALDLLSDMVSTPRLDDDELEREKKVVLEELGMAQDSPGDWVHQMLSELLWPSQPLGREIAGTPETVNAQTPGSLARYLRRTHGPANGVLVVAGRADADHVVAQAQRLFGATSSPAPVWEHARGEVGAPRIASQTRSTEQAYLALGSYGLARGDDDRYALRVANCILGVGMSSRLFLEVRERLGLTYDISSYVASYHDTGALGISASVDPDRAGDALDAIVAEVSRLRDEPVPDAELHKVKAYFRGSTLLGLEDSAAVASWHSSGALLSAQELSPEEVLARIDAVTTDDVHRVMNRVLPSGSFHLAHIGPDTDPDDLLARLQP